MLSLLTPLFLSSVVSTAAPLPPDARGRAAPDRNFDVERLVLDLDVDHADASVAGTATIHASRLWEGPLVLHQIDLDISAVEQDGVALRWWTEGVRLFVEVPGDTAVVTVTYSATPDNGLHFRYAGRGSADAYDEIWTQGEGEDHRHWFPSWDQPNDRFVYEGTIRGPEGWESVTNSGHDMVNYLVMFASAPYDRHIHPDDATIEVFVPPGTAAPAVARLLDPVAQMKGWMSERTGVDYPWGPYRQIFVQRFLYGGMENTSATINHDRLLGGAEVFETRPWNLQTVAHELAHQWYGDLLTCDGWREMWLNEGFASFFAADWMANGLSETWFPGIDGPVMWAHSVRHWRRHSVGDGAMAGRFHQGPDAAMNRRVYVKGAMTLQMLRVMLGEERFWAGIRAYTRDHQRGLVESRDLQKAMEGVSGRELDWFFQQWVELPTTPKLKVKHAYDGTTLVVTVKQRVGERRPAFTMPVRVSVGTAAGSVALEGWLEGSELTLRTELEEAPRYVGFDPQGGILAEIDQSQDTNAWVAQLDADEPLLRLEAIAALGETSRSEPLARIVGDRGRDPLTRALAATSLGEQRAAEELVPLLSTDHAYVRKAVADALAKAPGDDVAAALARAVQRDSNPDVQGAALKALAANDPARALVLARGLVRAPDRDHDRRATAALDVLGDHGFSGDLATLLASGQPRRVGSHGVRAAARLVLREPDAGKRKRLAERVGKAAHPLLEDVDRRSREAAVQVLRSVGTQSSIPYLERLARVSDIASLQQAARDAVTEIRSRKDAPAPRPNDLEARMMELEARLDALEKDQQSWLHGR